MLIIHSVNVYDVLDLYILMHIIGIPQLNDIKEWIVGLSIIKRAMKAARIAPGGQNKRGIDIQ